MNAQEASKISEKSKIKINHLVEDELSDKVMYSIFMFIKEQAEFGYKSAFFSFMDLGKFMKSESTLLYSQSEIFKRTFGKRIEEELKDHGYEVEYSEYAVLGPGIWSSNSKTHNNNFCIRWK